MDAPITVESREIKFLNISRKDAKSAKFGELKIILRIFIFSSELGAFVLAGGISESECLQVPDRSRNPRKSCAIAMQRAVKKRSLLCWVRIIHWENCTRPHPVAQGTTGS